MKISEGGRDFSFRGLVFMSLDGAFLLIDSTPNIAEAVHMLFPLLSARVPPFEEALDWLELAYTAGRTGAYVAPA